MKLCEQAATVILRGYGRGVLIAILLGSAALAAAQTTGSIRGLVEDRTGAVIAGAEIEATQVSTGHERHARSDASGGFVVPVLSPGRYRVTVQAAGFRAAVFDGIEVRVTETTRVAARLEIGDADDAITVTAAGNLLQAEGPQLGRSVPGSTVAGLPLATRNFTQALALSPGTSAFLPDATGTGRNTQPISVNGARPTQNNYRLNGVDINTLGTNGPVLVPVPAPETIEEFKVQTSMYDATHGRAGGANIQVLTRSGGDRYHGSGYEYLRNEALNANDGFLKSAGVHRPILRRNVFGGTFGGPVRPDRAFFFVSYQGTREKNGASLLNSISSGVLIAPGLTDDRSEAALLAGFAPPGPIDPRALALLNARLPSGAYLIPTPAADGTFTGSSASSFVEDQFNTNLDWRPRQNDLVSGKFFFANTSGYLPLPSFRGSGPNVPGFGGHGEFDNRVVSLQLVHTFSPRSINEARLGYSFNRNNTSPDDPVQDTSIGIARSTAAVYPGLPLIRIAPNSGGLIFGTAPAIDGRAATWTWTANDLLTVVRGHHTVRSGGELRFSGINYRIPNFSRGQIDFAGFTDFLLGRVQSSTLGTGLVGHAWRARDYDFFVQDDWRVTPRLTFNGGLRYELDLPVRDTEGRLVTFDPSLYQPRILTGGVTGPPAGGFVQAGNVWPQFDLPDVPNVSDTLLHGTDTNNFGPRAGFAWSPLPRHELVVRGGFGIFYSRPTFQYASLTDRLPPLYVLAVKRNSNLGNPFFALPPAASFPVFVPGVSLSGSAFDRALVTPMFQQFNFGVQYQLRPGLALEAGYVGSRGRHLLRQVSINAARLATAEDPVVNAVTGAIFTMNSPANAAARAPLQGVSINGFTLNESSGVSSYDSLQAGVVRSVSHGLQFGASYTWSKSLDNGSGQGGGAGPGGLLNTSSVGDTGNTLGNPADPHSNYGLSDFNRTHRVAGSFTWELPAPQSARRLLGGWETSGIVVLMSGAPIDIVDTGAGSFYGLDKGGSPLARPSLVSGATCASAMSNVPAGDYFNPAVFAEPVVLPGQPIPSSGGRAFASAAGTDVGNVGRNCLNGPAQADVDFSLARAFKVRETARVKVRAEFFNLLNHQNLSNPISNLGAVLPSGGSIDPNTGAVLSGGSFGRIVSSSSNPRIVQVSVRLEF